MTRLAHKNVLLALILISLIVAAIDCQLVRRENVTIVKLNSATLPTELPLHTPTTSPDYHDDHADYEDEDDNERAEAHNATGNGSESSANTDNSSPLNMIEDMMDQGQVMSAGEALLRLQSSLESGVSRLFKEMFPLVVRAGLELNISSPCTTSYMRVYAGLRETKNWAFHMIDSSGKPPSGILTGTLTDLGSFDQCLAIRHVIDDENESSNESIYGKYCLLDLRGAIGANLDSDSPPDGVHADGVVWDRVMREFWKRNDLLSFRYGLCVPSDCSAEDIQQFAQYISSPSGLDASVDHCQTAENLKFTPDVTQTVILSGLAVLAIMLIGGTLVDMILGEKNTTRTGQFIAYFSLYSNTIKLLGAKVVPIAPLAVSPDSPDLQCLNGLRFFSVCWVIIGHTYYYTDFILYHHYRNLAEITTIDDPLLFTPIANFTLSVDTFFYISGLLLIYTSWRKVERSNGRIDLMDFILHRIWRIWPTYSVVIGLAVVLPLIGSGPLWIESVEHQADNCRASWWYNLLFINNFQLSDQLCLLHTWYLSANMQFHLLSALILFVVYRSRLVGILLTIGGIGAMSAGTFYHAWSHEISAPTIIPDQVFSDYSQSIMGLYMKPYSHGAAYLTGLIGGWILLHYRQFVIGRKSCLSLWALGGILAVGVIISPHSAFAGTMPPVALSALYWATNRFLWALFIGWLVHACSTGRGGVLNDFLSWSGFVPLGSLSYLAYLVHPLLMMLHTGVARERVNFDHYTLITTFLQRTVVSFFMAYIIHIAVELPFAHLEKEIFPNRRKACPHISPPSSVRSTSVESIGHETASDSGATEPDHDLESEARSPQDVNRHVIRVLSATTPTNEKTPSFPLNSIFRGKLTGSYSMKH